MSNEKPIKCISAEYKSGAFYNILRNGKDTRFVVSFQNEPNTKDTILPVVCKQLTNDLQLKIRDFDDAVKPKEFSGFVNTQTLKEVGSL